MSADQATTKVVEHGEASRLPDTSWTFRRLLIFLVAIVCLFLTWQVLGRVSDVVTLRMIARYSLGLVALCLFLYVGGASATDVVRLVSAVRTTRKETLMSGPPPATATPEGVTTGAVDDGELPADQRIKL